MESTAAVSVSRCRGRSQFFTQGRGLTEQLPNKKITGRYFWHSRTHKGQHRRFTVFPGSRSSFTQKRPTDRENKKPTWHALGWRFVGTKNESSVSSDWKETIQPIWRRSLLLFQRWPTTTSLWLRIDFQEFFFLLSSLTQKKWQLFQGHFALVAHLHTIVVGMSDGRDGGNQHNPPNRNQTPKEKNTTPLDCYDYYYYYTTNNNKTLFSVSF